MLLSADDPPAFELVRRTGRSPYLLTADHAGRAVPRRLGDLGVPGAAMATHIASDLGIAELARGVSERLDAWLILQSYSRLLIDANRPPGSPQSIVTLSERTRVPGNERLSAPDAEAREREILQPYHDCIRDELEQRAATNQPIALCSLHSFTPTFMGITRPWHIGVLFNRDARLARVVLQLLRQDRSLTVGENEPYSVSDETDYTVVVHGERRGIPHVEIEIRQDLIATETGQASWSDRLAGVLRNAYAAIDPT
ncbi:MAG: N-formylglutamate amidohydrolase [Mycobacteriales bacterium]